jgi:hypothetical protein
MTVGRPLRPVNALITCWSAESSATIYMNNVTSLQYLLVRHSTDGKCLTYVKKLKYRAATIPYLCLVHSVRTNPSGHFLLIIGPSKPKTRSGKDEESA